MNIMHGAPGERCYIKASLTFGEPAEEACRRLLLSAIVGYHLIGLRQDSDLVRGAQKMPAGIP